MVLYSKAMSDLKEKDEDRRTIEDQLRRERAAAATHEPTSEGGVPFALHEMVVYAGTTPIKATLGPGGTPAMKEGAFIRMTHVKREKVDYLTTGQAAPLIHLAPYTIGDRCRQGHISGAWQAGGVGVGAWRIPATGFWTWAQKEYPTLIVRIQAHWPKGVVEPWKG